MSGLRERIENAKSKTGDDEKSCDHQFVFLRQRVNSTSAYTETFDVFYCQKCLRKKELLDNTRKAW